MILSLGVWCYDRNISWDPGLSDPLDGLRSSDQTLYQRTFQTDLLVEERVHGRESVAKLLDSGLCLK